MKRMILSAIEKSINSYLELDPEVIRYFNKLESKVIKVRPSLFESSFYFLFRGKKITLVSDYSGEPDVIINGSVFDFLRLSFSTGNSAIFSSDVEVNGDIEVAETFRKLFSELSIDWEEQLSHFTGDIFARRMGNVVRGFSSWAKKSGESMRQNLSEYVHEEICLFPPRAELQDFFSEIDAVKHTVERLEKRLARLSHLSSGLG